MQESGWGQPPSQVVCEDDQLAQVRAYPVWGHLSILILLGSELAIGMAYAKESSLNRMFTRFWSRKRLPAGEVWV